tara:strand:- start:1127 stop:1825 length:699 start_codon:yes stop_codon:yes gene_type:complete
MIISIHQPNYAPWGGYFYKLFMSDLFIFLNDVQFSKNSFINRTKVCSVTENSWLTIPVKFNLGDKINNVRIAQIDWQDRHLSKINNLYRKSPYFFENWTDIELLFRSLQDDNLADINKKIILTISSWLEIKFSYKDSSSFTNLQGLKAEERLIDIIKKCKCDQYLSGLGAKKYQDEKKFIASKIKLLYSDFSYIEQKSKNNLKNINFGTSILDLIFNLGRQDTIKYIKGNFV